MMAKMAPTRSLSLLDRVTIGYILTLVVVLAASLITIVWYLWRIGTVLGQIKQALGDVARHTQPLDTALTTVNGDLEAIATSLVRARDSLAAAEVHLASATQPASVAVPAATAPRQPEERS